jgi:hypothetical protein
MKTTKPEKRTKPEDIRADIERTREHMDESLTQLSRKIRVRWRMRLRQLALPLAGIVLAGVGAVVFRKLRRPKPAWGRIKMQQARTQPVVKAAGLLDQVLLMRALVMAAKKGKPAIYVVQPAKK